MGRKKVITKKVWDKLEESFMLGLSDAEACLRAGISKPTLYDYLEEHKDLKERKDLLKNNVRMHAKVNIAEKVIKEKSIELSKYILEKTDKEFSNKLKIEEENTQKHTIQFIDDIPPEKEEITDFSKERTGEK